MTVQAIIMMVIVAVAVVGGFTAAIIRLMAISDKPTDDEA